MESEERMACRTGKRTRNTTTCHNMTVRGGRGRERERDRMTDGYQEREREKAREKDKEREQSYVRTRRVKWNGMV